MQAVKNNKEDQRAEFKQKRARCSALLDINLEVIEFDFILLTFS